MALIEDAREGEQVTAGPGAGSAQRLEALARYRVLDTPPEPEFDDIVALAAELSGMPLAAVTFVDSQREFVKASYGGRLPQAALRESLGARAIAAPHAPLAIRDLLAEDGFPSARWAIDAPHVRSYVAVPLVTPGGLPIGTLCALAPDPRDPARDAVASLERLARVVLGHLERRREAALAHNLLVVIGFDGRLKRVSESSESLLGWKPTEMVGHPVVDFLHPDDVARTRQRLEGALAGDPGTGFENRYRCKDGSYRWLLWNGQMVPEEQLFYGDGKDITDRKLTELAVRRSEERYRLLAENATDMISSHTMDGTITYASRACEALMGYASYELYGRSAYEFMHPDDVGEVRAVHARLVDDAGRGRTQFRLRRRSGEYVWVEALARVVRDDDGSPVAVQAATRDVSESRAALEALESAEERFRKAFDEAPIGMAILDLEERRIQRVNRALCELLGYEPEDLLGRDSLQFTAQPDLGLTKRLHEDLVAQSERCLSIEKRYIHKDGHEVWGQASASLMRDGDGNPVGLLAQVQDITQRRLAEEETRRAREEAERANLAKSEFLSRMSHELRTPLNAVLGFAQLLQLDELTTSQRESVERIIAGGGHLLELMNDVLDISRIEAGQLQVCLEPHALAPIVDEAVELVRSLAATRSIEIAVEIPAGERMRVEADRQRLRQVLLNLLSNAIKYSPEGSPVRVVAGKAGDSARLSVVDRGPGISEHERERLFVPFERLSAARGVEGTGLGLALSRQLVECMNGTIGVESGKRGSTFWIELPLASSAKRIFTPRRGRGPELQGAIAGRRLLYVEDTASDAALVQQALSKRGGLTVDLAGTGAEGLERARRDPPDLILLDLGLPDMDGRQVLGALREHPATKDVPVFIVTGEAVAADEPGLLELGATAVETKPIRLDRLVAVLERALAGAAVR